MQIIIPENINLFTCDEGIKFSPVVDGVISDCYLISWEEVLDIAGRLLILKKHKDEFESGKSPF